VAEEQNTDRFPAHRRHQSSFDYFFRHQSTGPPGESLGRVAADQGDNSLFLTFFQQRFGTRPMLQRRQRHHTRNPRRTDPFGQLQKGQDAQYDPHLLNAATQQFLQLLPIFVCNLNALMPRAPYLK
jgi:hypothetical protein